MHLSISPKETAVTRFWPFLFAASCALAVLGVGLVHGQTRAKIAAAVGELTTHAEQGFVGSSACAGCHDTQSKAWAGSQHSRAMQPASRETVLGDFNDAAAAHFDSRARFLERDGRFVVETEDKDGKAGQFRVDYTFGLEPL